MTRFLTGLARGATAGAAGTTALNLTSGADAAIRARKGSSLPQRLVGELADRAHVRIPGGPGERSRRIAALGPVAGALAGVAVGAVAGGLRAAGVRLPDAVGGPLLGAAAMLATDGPAAFTGIADPRTWSTRDWVADVLPHLAYGLTAHRTLVALDDAEPAPRAPVATLVRAAALGAASGARSTSGVAALALSTRPGEGGTVLSRWASRPGSVAAVTVAAGELVTDKQPWVPSRLGPPGLLPRIGLGAAAAAGLAGRQGTEPALPAVVAGLAAAGSAVAGVRLRAVAAERFGSDRPGAFAEDGVAALLGWWATRR